MPLYVYKCEACEHEFEVYQGINDDPLEECEKCGEMQAKRQIARASFQLVGNGWADSGYSN